MALAAVLEADLRALSAEARRRYPAVKDAAEHAILKLRSISDPTQISRSDDILKLILVACEARNVKLSVLGLSCLQKLIAHDAVSPLALPHILATLHEHSDIYDEGLQLKSLQIILTILQSQLHPEDEVQHILFLSRCDHFSALQNQMAILLGLCLRLLGNNRNADSVHSTAAATLRQAVALIFERVVEAEALPAHKIGASRRASRSISISGDVSRSIIAAKADETAMRSNSGPEFRETVTQEGRLGLRLLEDLTSLAAGASATWLSGHSLSRTFTLDLLDYVVANYVSLFRKIRPYQQVLRQQVCSLLITSLRTATGVEGEPAYRRIVLKTVANMIRLYSSVVIEECQVLISMLVKSTEAGLPFWHRIMVLEILRGFCIEARILRFLFETFDMQPENTNVVGSIVKSLARIVTSMQMLDSNEESLLAVSGMFTSKAKGVEWAMESDSSGSAMAIASEAHAITLAVEGLLGVVFTVATLTDEAVDAGEISSPRCENPNSAVMTMKGGEHASVCISMVSAVWRTLLEALSLVLSRCQGEALVLEILKAYQAFTQACGVLRMVEPRDSFLASLCRFTVAQPVEPEKSSGISIIPLTPSALRRAEHHNLEQRENFVLTPKNVQALRTVFNIAHRLDSVLGSSWVLVLETLAMIDRVIHSPHATTQEVSAVVPRVMREQGGQSSDFNILSTLDTQLFESSGLMSTAAVSSLLAGLVEVSNSALLGITSGLGQAGTGTGSGPSGVQAFNVATKTFAVERMISVLVHNVHRAYLFWDELTSHLLQLTDHESPQVRTMALEALDRAICAVLASDQMRRDSEKEETEDNFEVAAILPIRSLYASNHALEARSTCLKILQHVLERHSEKLYFSWPSILELLRSVANTSEKELVPLGFQSLRIILNDGLISIPPSALDLCVEVAGAYGGQKTDVNISLTAVGLLWATSDFFARGIKHEISDTTISEEDAAEAAVSNDAGRQDLDSEKLLLSVFAVIQSLAIDDRPEVRNSAIRTFFQAVTSHGHKFSVSMWEHCLWKLTFPLIETVRHLAATSSKDEWRGKELGMQGGKPVHMLVHHSRNTAQKQWDESLVLVLNGISRLFRSFLPLFQTINNFRSGWDSLLTFAHESILDGSKEVSLAAISALQTITVCHASKGSMLVEYFESTFSTYRKVTYSVCHPTSTVLAKAKQELLQSLGELYSQGSQMFEATSYLQLLGLADLISRFPVNAIDGPAAGRGGIPQVQRTTFEVLPLLKPLDARMESLWPNYLQQLLSYLPGGDILLCEHCRIAESFMAQSPKASSGNLLNYSQNSGSSSPLSEEQHKGKLSVAFSEKIIGILNDLYPSIPTTVKDSVLHDIIAALGRCMGLRRDFPDAPIWRSSIKCFVNIMNEEFKEEREEDVTGVTGLWRALSEVYEIFLVGTCGRAVTLPVGEKSLANDELLEASMLQVLCDKMFARCEGAPQEVIERFVGIIDRCAARASALPLETAAVLPANCGRFSLLCLRSFFRICSCEGENSSKIRVSKIAVTMLLARCDAILRQYANDDCKQTAVEVPAVRIDEVVLILQELSKLLLHPSTAASLCRSNSRSSSNCTTATATAAVTASQRTHLLLLYLPLCELVISREYKVREIVRGLLLQVGNEIGVVDHIE